MLLCIVFIFTINKSWCQTDREQVRQLRLDYETYWKKGDAEGVMTTLWEDAILMPHHGDPVVAGKEAILAFWFPKDAAPSSVTVFDSEISEIKVAGDHAYIMGTFQLVFEYEQKRYTNQGNFINIAERRQGEWRLSRLIWNDPQPTITPMKNTEIPYYEIPDAPETYNACTVAARMIDGLGFRYYWATEGLREEDLAYKTSPAARTSEETLEHIYSLVQIALNAVKKASNIRPNQQEELTFADRRKATLLMLKEASDILKASDPAEMEHFNLVFQRGERQSVSPFWNLLNGPLADALWHTGQVVAFRRASGNPFDGRVSVFQGKLRER